MDTLETVFRPVINMVNRRIAATTPARELTQELNGSVIALRIQNTGLAAFFHVRRQSITMTGEFSGDPDVVISGTLLGLMRLAGEDGESAIRDGSVDLTGDTEIAQAFQKLLRYGRPDIEEELAHVVGDTAAHQVGELARGFGDWARRARSTIGQNISEYLQEESRDVPSRYEVDAFADDVDRLRDDVDRLAAKISHLEEQRKDSPS